MSYSINGGVISDMEFTRSWGLSPGSGSITCPGPVGSVIGGDAVLSIGATSFFGVLSNSVQEEQDGVRTRMSFADNRIKLMWDDVYCLFNRIEVRPDNPSTPGIDRQKRYVHILPDDWAKQKKTYTPAPLSARDIIAYLFSAPTVAHSWSAIFDPLQNKAVHEIDALNGKKLGSALQEISDAQGLLFTLVGQSQLYWVQKGSDSAPAPDLTHCDDLGSGEAVSAVDTQVSVVGDRNRYQDININLEADWISDYEAFWSEPDWLDEVSGAFGLANGTFAERAALAAKARKVTVREYVAVRGDDLADFGMWGEVSRMEIPVWTYLQDIVFKAYRVPRDYTFNGVPLDSLELVEGLLCAVNYSLSGTLTYKQNEKYPDAKAFVVVQGQPLSLLDPTKQRVISQAEIDRAYTDFQPNNRFNFDTRNKVIIFEEAVFRSQDLFIFPNADVSDASEALKAVAVPNAQASIEEATVIASLVWDAEKYLKIFGGGPRKGPHYVQGLSKHELFNGGSSQGEIAYADGQNVDDKAQEIADSLVSQQATYASGGFRRNGAWGTELNGSTDRVTITLTFDGGITERVEYSKERSQSNFENERDLERKQRARDLFPGQRDLKDDVKNLELIAKVTKELKRSPLQPVYGSLAALLEKPIGSPDCSVSKIYSGDTWLAGSPIFLDANDTPASSGERFGGIVIAENVSGAMPCATQGIVPVRVQGPIKTGDQVGIDTGDGQVAKKDGKLPLGKANDTYSGSDVVLLPVRLGAGGGSVPETPFLVVSRTRVLDDGVTQITELGVISNSHVRNSEDRDTYEEENEDWGLLNDDRDDGWFAVGEIGDKIWLEIRLNRDQSIASIDVRHGSAGGTEWDEYPDPISINTEDPGNPYQEFYNQLIAELTDPEQDPRPGFAIKNSGDADVQVTQVLFTNLELTTAHTTKDADEPLLPILVALPSDWPGTEIDGSADEINNGEDIMTPFALGDFFEKEAPFQVVGVNNEDSTSLIGVVSNSHLLNSEDRDTYEENNEDWGLLSDDRTDGAFEVGEIGDKIWLQITLNRDQSIAAIDVKQGQVGGIDWDEFPDPISINVDDPEDPYQEFYNQIIAEITDPEQDPRPGLIITKSGDVKVQVTQLLFTNLEMTTGHTTADADEPNLPIIVAIPWNGPATAIDGSADEINDGEDIMTPFALGEAFETETPFQVVHRTVEGVDQLGVISNSHLFNGEDKDTYEEENDNWGLLDDGRTTGWFDVGDVGDKIWLTIRLNADQSISTIDVNVGPRWDGYPDPININTVDPTNPYQEFYYQIIAELTDPSQDPRPGFMVSDGDVQVTQLLFSNLMMATAHTTKDADEPHIPLLVAIPSQNLPGTDESGSADEINDGEDIMTPFSLGPVPNPQFYAFECFDASDEHHAKVLIMDGDVIDQDGQGHTPEGMGGDDYVLECADGDSIYLVIPHDDDWNVVDPVTLAAAQDVPDDTASVSYIEIAYVDVVTVGGRSKVTPHNVVCGDYLFNPPLDHNVYAFKMTDASTPDAAKILISDGDVIDQDGNGHTPDGMGSDNYVLDVADGQTIYLVIPRDENWNVIDPVTIGIADEVPDDTDSISYVEIGYVEVTDEFGPEVIPHNTVCGDYPFDPPPETNAYGFKMLDASTPDVARVLILDGDVIDLEGNGHTPTGMGTDNYILEVSDGDSIYLVIPHNDLWHVIDPVTIGIDDSVPDDTDTISYVEIGYIEVLDEGFGPQVTAHNTVCGDYPFNPPTESNTYSFKMLDASDGDTARVRLLDGNVLDTEGEEHLPTEMGSDGFVRDVEDGDDLFMVIYYNIETGEIFEPVTIDAGVSPDDEPGKQVVTIGYVNVITNEDGTKQVIPHNALCGDYVFEPDAGEEGYSFQLLDATVTNPLGGISAYQVQILDGSVIDDSTGEEFVPSGMGDDDYILAVSNGDSVYLVIPFNPDTLKVVEPVTLAAGEVPDNTDSIAYVEIGYVSIDSDNQRLVIRNTLAGDYVFRPPPDVTRFSFKMIDASDDGGPKIKILDGQVVAVKDVSGHGGTTPAGMGTDDFVLNVNDGDEIWLDISLDDSDGISAVSINNGADIPDDEDNRKFVRIGSVAAGYVDGVAYVIPANTLCGDYYFSEGPGLAPYEVTLIVNPDTSSVRASVNSGELINQWQKNDIDVGGTEAEHTVSIGSLVWLEVALSDWETPTSANVIIGGAGGWNGSVVSFPDQLDFNNDPEDWDGSDPAPQQTHAYVLIAEIIADDNGKPAVRQCVNTNLMLMPVAWFGLTASAIYPGFGST